MRRLVAALVLLGTSPALINANAPDVEPVVGAAAGLVYIPQCTYEQSKEIREGMSVGDVAAILRCPPGDYTGGKGVYIAYVNPFPVAALRREHAKYWCGRRGAIGLALDTSGKVKYAAWYPALDPPP